MQHHRWAAFLPPYSLFPPAALFSGKRFAAFFSWTTIAGSNSRAAFRAAATAFASLVCFQRCCFAACSHPQGTTSSCFLEEYEDGWEWVNPCFPFCVFLEEKEKRKCWLWLDSSEGGVENILIGLLPWRSSFLTLRSDQRDYMWSLVLISTHVLSAIVARRSAVLVAAIVLESTLQIQMDKKLWWWW